MSRKRFRTPISFGVASVCVAACSSMNPLSKSTIQSSMEAEELIAPVEVATELQGIDAIPIAKSGGPVDGAADRESGGPGGTGNIDPITGQLKGEASAAATAVGAIAGKNAVGTSGRAGTGSINGQANGRVSPGSENASSLLGAKGALRASAGSTGRQATGTAGVAGVNQTANGSGADAVALGSQALAGKDAVVTASGDSASAQPLNADGSPAKAGGNGKDAGSSPGSMGRGPASAEGAQIIDYRVKEGDTLMKIAFEVFGDLTRWREIHDLNQEVVSDPNVLTKGTRLRIKVFGVRTVSRNGEAYLIKRGDTLQKISQWVYGTISKWKQLWDNNRELIRDPNKIFAGFKLYFVREQDPKRIPASNPGVSPPHETNR